MKAECAHKTNFFNKNMNLIRSLLLIASMASASLAQTIPASCFVDSNGDFNLTLTSCSKYSFEAAITNAMLALPNSTASKCRSWLTETRRLFRNLSLVADDIQNLCNKTQEEYAKNNRVTMRDLFDGVFTESPIRTTQDDYQFFLGGTELNTDDNSPTEAHKAILSASAIKVKTQVLEWPGTSQNFKRCSSKAVICCWTDVPESKTNTDVCYIDNRAPYAGQVSGGFYLYPAASEGSVNCHGFTVGDERYLESYRFRGNALFQLAVNHGLLENNFTSEIAGAPMCSCADDAPVIDKADCSEIKIDESYAFKWSKTANATLTHSFNGVSLESCKDESGAVIGLRDHYYSMVAAGVVKPTALGSRPFNNTVVGDGNCGAVMTSFLKSRNYTFY